MPSYIWSCLACGTTNRPGEHACPQCACPAAASTRQIAAYRDAFRMRGGIVLPGAGKLPEDGDNDVPKAVWHVVRGMLKFIFGIPGKR